MTRTVMPSIKPPWQVIIIDDRITTYALDVYWVQVYNKQSMVLQSPPFSTSAAAANWARDQARDLRIIKQGEAR